MESVSLSAHSNKAPYPSRCCAGSDTYARKDVALGADDVLGEVDFGPGAAGDQHVRGAVLADEPVSAAN